ncbi:MAG: RDD family protein [Erysipelotrichaceae bacterium]
MAKSKVKKPSIEQRLMDTVKVPLEWVEAPAWKRIFAFIFDMTLILPFTNYLMKVNTALPAIVTLVYFVGFEMSPWKGTIGKRMMSLKVIDENKGKVRLSQLVIRYLSKIISLAMIGVGYWPLLSKEPQRAYPDRISHTMVIALTPSKTK